MTNCEVFDKAVRGLLRVLLLSILCWPLLSVGQNVEESSADMEFWEDLAFWETIKDSDNPEEFALYLELYPQGRFVQLARLRLRTLGGESSDTSATPVVETPSATSRPEPTDVNTFRDCPECPLMVTISAGTFTMGSTQRPDEQPVREVNIGQDFALGVYPVTVGEWRYCVDAGGCRFQPDSAQADNLPVSGVSWDDTQDYINWLNGVTQGGYRLPSEAEWEYAARAGTTTDFWWGDEAGDGLANCQNCGSRWDDEQPSPVGSFQANPWGLYDIHGNVWEWVEDCWQNHYRNAPADGSAYSERFCIEGVQRGGTYRLDSEYMRTSRRFRYDRDVRFVLNGFRVAKTL